MASLPSGDPAPVDGSVPASALIGAESRSLHAYVHIPFCRVRCGYCDFNTYTSSELRGVTKSSFLEDLIAEINFSGKILKNFPSREFGTVFFGGGTPSEMEASALVRVLDELRAVVGIKADAEVTTEANPDNVTAEYLAELAAGGFNRVSIGMQSAVPSVLATLDRTHNPDNVARAVSLAKDVGLQTSVDLIYGAPGESIADWRNSVEVALSLGVDHISAYSLIVEPGTKLAQQIKNGKLPEPDEDEQAEKYEIADQMFKAAGFDWYEVSNWSRSLETRSKHNLAYWQSNDWWGYGPGAHSHLGGVRWWNQKHPATYAERIAAGESPALAREVLSDEVRLTERILLEVRIADGMPIDLVKEVNSDYAKVISQAISDGIIDGRSAVAGRMALTLKGRLLADALVRDLLG